MLREIISHIRPVYVKDCLGEHRVRSLARVGSIAMANQLSGMGLRLISTVVLSRLLPPSTFGLVAMVVFFRGLMSIFGAAGFVEAAVQKKSLTLNQLNGIFWLNAGVCTFLAIIFIACGPLISSFYGEPELTAICLVFGLLFILENLFLTHGALLRRTMNYELSFVVSFFPQVVALVVSITMALCGFEVWSLVGGAVISVIIGRLFYLYFVRWNPGELKLEAGFKEIFSYGIKSSAATVVSYFSQYSQTLALGKFASAADVGLYNRGQALFQIPIQQVAWPVAQLMLPALASLQDDRKKMFELILRATWLVALLAVPFTLFMVVYGDWFIVWLVGKQWEVSGQVAQWLAVASIPSLITNLIARGNAAIGRPGRGVPIALAGLPFLLFGIYTNAQLGPVMVAQFYALYRWILYPIAVAYHLKGSGFDIGLFLRSQFQLLLIGSITFTLLALSRAYFLNSIGVVQLAIMLLAGSVAYFYFLLSFRYFLLGKSVLSWLYSHFGQKARIPRWFFY
jgi:O-antigen/teichoic acid export membrane protein